TATAASVRSAAVGATFPVALLGTTLDLTVTGPTGQVVSTIDFTPGNAITPLSSPPTFDEVVDYLSRFANGVRVFKDASTSQLVIVTDVAGTSAQLLCTGSAIGPLTLGAVTPASGNVADIDQVTFAEIAAQLQLPGKIAVTQTGAGQLQIASAANG